MDEHGDGVSESALRLHRRARVVDAHADTLLDVVQGRRQLTERSTEGHVDLPRLLEGGVDLQFFATWTAPFYRNGDALVRVIEMIQAFRAEQRRDGRLVLVRSAADLEQVGKPGRVCGLLSLEGGEALAGSTKVLEALYEMGVRAVGLTWNGRNALADGVEEGASGGGLTRAGRAVVRALQALHMLIDVAHISPAGFWDVLELAEIPVIASHANCRRLCDNPRNLSDEQILALASRGGVVGVTFVPEFVKQGGPEQSGAETGDVHIADVVAHIDHICELVGPRHVGIGSDFDGTTKTPVELPDVSFLPRLTEALLVRGYRESEVELILGGNFLRVLQQVL